jgi:hypothetical protein
MESERERAIRFLDFRLGGGLADAEDVVVVLLAELGRDVCFHFLLFFISHWTCSIILLIDQDGNQQHRTYKFFGGIFQLRDRCIDDK